MKSNYLENSRIKLSKRLRESIFSLFFLLVIFVPQNLFAQATGTLKEVADQGNKKKFKSVGTVTLTLQGGIQSITNYLRNNDTGEERTIEISDAGSPYSTIILSLRFGTQVEGWEDINNGFRYNRSNRGFFTDFEFGVKTYSFGSSRTDSFASFPTKFTINHTAGPNTLGSNGNGIDSLGNEISSQEITLGERVKSGDNTIALFPWEVLDGITGLTSEDPTKYSDNDYYNYLGIDTTDAGVRDILKSHGVAATKSMTIFINSYYHLLSLGSFFDSSMGLSFRLNRYVDFTDLNRFVSYNSDNFDTVIGIIFRNYFNFGKKARLKASYMFPIVGFFTNRLKRDDFNQEEHIAELSIEYYAIPFVYVSLGAQYSYFPYNKRHPYSNIRNAPEGGDAEVIPGVRPVGRGITFIPGQYNYGFSQTRRDSLEIYLSVSFDVNL